MKITKKEFFEKLINVKSALVSVYGEGIYCKRNYIRLLVNDLYYRLCIDNNINSEDYNDNIDVISIYTNNILDL